MNMLSSRNWIASFVLPLALTAACGSESENQRQAHASGGSPGSGGSFGSGGQGAPGNGGSRIATGGQAVSSGGSPLGGAGTFPMGGGGMSTAGTTGAGGASGSAGGAASGAGGAVAAGGSANGSQTLPPTSDYAEPGPFTSTSTANQGPGGGYTIFRPEPLGADGFMHSPIIFGPGILTTASLYTSLLEHLASHGFVTICVNSMSGGPNAPANLQAMRDGLDWLIAQNDEAGPFQGKLAVNRAVTMGYSIGATASTQLSSHEAILTTVSIHGHDTSGDPLGPVLLLTGTDDVIDSNRSTLATLEEAPAMLAALPIGHLDVLTELAMTSDISASTRYIAPITAWLRYWINGDENAKQYFWGAGCSMCSSPWITPETNAAWDAQAL